jgi:hypothetical protein
MVPRSVPALTVAVLLVAGCLGAQAQPAEKPVQRAPNDLERLLQAEYLDRSFVLRVDVKMIQITSRRVVSSTVASGPALDLLRPTTVATGAGVFYLSDYARKERLASDVHVALGSPGILPSDDPQGGFVQTADVVEISGEPKVFLGAGDLARITGVEEIPGYIQVTLEGFEGGPVQALVRPEVEIHRPAAERAKGAMAALGQLFFVLPEDPETWVQAEWPERIRTAIRERRVVEEMTREQVLLAWGTPLYLSGDEETGTQVWTYQHGATLREQLRNRSRVYLVLDTVVQVEEDR